MPLWMLGMTTHVTLTGGRVAVVHDGRLAVLDADGSVTDVDVPFTGWSRPMIKLRSVVLP